MENYYNLGIEEIEKELNTNKEGLSNKEVNERIESMKFNTAMSSLMVYCNYMTDMTSIPVYMLEIMVKLIYPFAPHIAEEMWQKLSHNKTITFEKWPSYDNSVLVLDTCHMVISVNGKKRAEIDLPIDISDNEIKEKVKSIPAIASFIEGKTLKNIIIVKNKLVNIVI